MFDRGVPGAKIITDLVERDIVLSSLAGEGDHDYDSYPGK